MRVLYVSHTGLISGAEGALLDLVAALPATVHPVVACPRGPLADRLRTAAVEVHQIPPVTGSFKLTPVEGAMTIRELVAASRSLTRIVDDARPDILHANSVRAGLVARLARAHRRVPVVVHGHDVLPNSRSASLVRSVLSPACDVLITISEYTARSYMGRGLDGRVRVLYNPLDTDRFDPGARSQKTARAQLGLPASRPLLALVAQITPWKGHITAIRAVAALRARFPDLTLLIVGEAKFTSRATRFDNLAYLEQIKRLVAELDVAHNVEFWGERPDVEVILRAVDVSLTPSWEEPFGRSVIEAMALATPPVATNVGGPAEYIDNGSDGLLVAPTDLAAWIRAIGGLLEAPKLRVEMGRRASEQVRSRFERAAYASSVVEVYEQALADRTARSAVPPGRSGYVAPPPRLRPRVLFVEHSSLMGGGQHSLAELIRGLRVTHEVVLACPLGPLADVIAVAGVTVHPLPDSQLTFKLRFRLTPVELARTLRARAVIRRLIRQIRPDVIHANSVRAGLLVAGQPGCREIVVHCRDLLPAGLVADIVRSVLVRFPSAVIAVSEASARRLGGPDWARRGIVTVDNPVDTLRFDPEALAQADARHALSLTGGPILGMIGQITPWKGQVRAVRVLEALRHERPEAQLLIVGETKFVSRSTSLDNQTYEATLQNLVHELGLGDAVHMLGERPDVERIMACLDVLLVPSSEEPFGRTIIEAMAMGIPVIATDAGGPAEIIRPQIDGVTLPVDDTLRWAQAARSLADRGPRAESRDYAVAHFDSKQHAAAIASIYEQVLNRL